MKSFHNILSSQPRALHDNISLAFIHSVVILELLVRCLNLF
jgi:hypothetical protein